VGPDQIVTGNEYGELGFQTTHRTGNGGSLTRQVGPLDGLLLIDDAYWGGKKRDGKRGRGASGKMPFVAALSLSDKGHPLFLKLGHLSGFTLDEISACSTKHIRPESLFISNG
jgi:hypothetical protein